MKINNKKFKAFTLAEVLITLTIIGVVAAVTVPTLTKKTGNQEIVTRLQKAYSVLSQATDEIIMEKGKPGNRWFTDVDVFYETYKEHLRNAKECGSEAGCMASNYYNLDGSADNDFNSNKKNYRKLILSDGMVILFSKLTFSTSCTGLSYGSRDVCGAIFVDINGKKGPNTRGRDFFPFVLKNDGLYPRGCDNPPGASCDNNTQMGYSCTCRVIEEGKISY